MPSPQRKTAHLSRHRASLPGARYFVTCCTRARTPGLTSGSLPAALLATLESIETTGDADLACATLMPDHFHWVFTLGARLTVSQVIGKWKTGTGRFLSAAGLAWQPNFFEHRLRGDEDVEGYAFYVFMNPYMQQLLPPGQAWPWWRKGAEVSFRFEEHLRGGAPHLEWLGQAWARGVGLAVTR